MLPARIALDSFGYLSQFVQFNVALLVALLAFLCVEPIGCSFGGYPISSLSTTSFPLPILSSSFEVASWTIPWVLRSTSNSGSSFSSVGSRPSRNGFPMTAEVGLFSESGSCCCCESQLLLSTIFGAGRGVEGLSNKVFSPLWELTL